jgi:hypothetical protein
VAFRLSQHTPLDEDLRRLADVELSGAVDRLLDLHAAPDPRVHAARKAIKRVRALLRLVRAGLPARRFRTHNLALRDAARELSATRDAAVALATFDRLILADDPLVALRPTLAPASSSRDPAATPLHAAAEALGRVRPDLIADLDGLRFADLEAGLKDSYLGGREAMFAAQRSSLPDDEAFHTWRKRAKDLWYQSQLLRDACPPLLGALEGMLDELGELLGEDHDLAVLQAATPANDALQRRITARHLELRDAAWRSGQRIYAERPRAFVHRLRSYWQIWHTEP